MRWHGPDPDPGTLIRDTHGTLIREDPDPGHARIPRTKSHPSLVQA